jgi:hypothetical protein
MTSSHAGHENGGIKEGSHDQEERECVCVSIIVLEALSAYGALYLQCANYSKLKVYVCRFSVMGTGWNGGAFTDGPGPWLGRKCGSKPVALSLRWLHHWTFCLLPRRDPPTGSPVVVKTPRISGASANASTR